MRIQVLEAHDPAWDTFVRSTSDGRLCHLQAWSSMISRTFGYTTLNLAARAGVVEGQGLCGVLPLTLVRSRIFPTRLVSQAFSNYGGPLLSDATALAPLLERAMRLAVQLECRQLELRATMPLFAEGPVQSVMADPAGRQSSIIDHQSLFHLSRDKVCMHLPLPADPDELWHQVKPEIRNRIRKAQKSGLTVVDGAQDLLPDFYDVWTRRMRQLGTPCYSRRLFENILQSFPQEARIFLVKHGRATVGAGFFHHFRDLAECRWAATDIRFNDLAPNILLYWAALSHYCRTDLRLFDFGRSSANSSQYEFKRRWGARPVQLFYHYWSPGPEGVEPLTPDSPRYRRKVALWKRLPLAVTRLAGPALSRALA